MHYYLRYKIIVYCIYVSNDHSGSSVGQDQAFWTTDTAKQDFEVQYMSDWISSYYTNTAKYKGHKKEHVVKKYNKS
jgi:hypothetical protein